MRYSQTQSYYPDINTKFISVRGESCFQYTTEDILMILSLIFSTTESMSSAAALRKSVYVFTLLHTITMRHKRNHKVSHTICTVRATLFRPRRILYA